MKKLKLNIVRPKLKHTHTHKFRERIDGIDKINVGPCAQNSSLLNNLEEKKQTDKHKHKHKSTLHSREKRKSHHIRAMDACMNMRA